MYNGLKGKVAVVTGGSKGIGNAIARRLSEEKMKVVINYHSDKEGAEETVEELKKLAEKLWQSRLMSVVKME